VLGLFSWCVILVLRVSVFFFFLMGDFFFFFLLSEENWLLYLVELSTSMDWGWLERGSLGESIWFALEMFIQLGYFL